MMKKNKFPISKIWMISAVWLMAASTFAQTNVTLEIDYSLDAQKPDANMKRGYILRDALALSNANILGDLDEIKANGCELVTLPRDLNQFDPQYTNGYYYESYKSQGSNYFGGDGELEEFRKVNGQVVARVNTNFLAMCQKARDNGLRMIIQASGTPVKGNNNGRVTQMFALDPTRQFHESARFYALPAPSQYGAVATKVADWMEAIKNGVGVNNIIWAGHQEPSHTPGYPNGIQTNAGTEDNIVDYVSVWKPLAQEIKSRNLGKVAGIQLNQAQHHYKHAIEEIDRLNVPIDFFSIQNYKGEKNQVVINEAKTQLANHGLGNKKILFNRYDFKAGFHTPSDRYNSAAGMTQFLKNELVLLNNADAIYGYSLFMGAIGQPMMNQVMKFLNKMPVRRRNIAGIGQGVNAWCTANGSDFYMALWNSSNGNRNVTVNLSKFPNAYNSHQMNIRKAIGSSLSEYSNASWSPGTSGSISNIILGPDEFVLIQLNNSGSAARSALENEPEELKIENELNSQDLKIFPNPSKNLVNIELNKNHISHDISIFDTTGRMIKIIEKSTLKEGKNQVDISNLESGVYYFRIGASNASKHRVVLN